MVISSRVSRCAAATIAVVAAASLAACGSSGTPSASSSSTAKPTTGSSSAPAPAAAGKDRTFGLVSAVSGSTVMVTGPKGSATVDVTPSTRVTQLAAGKLTDVTAGECVMVRPTRDSGGPPNVTARAVLVGQPANGKCGPPGGRGRGVVGTVASVNGSSITLKAADNGQTTVTVTSNTRYAMRTTADTSAIATGQCLAARGTKDGNGNLQATAVNLRPAVDGRCGGGRHQGA